MTLLNPATRSTLLLMAGAVMISFSGVWVKLADVGPTTAGFYRTFLGGLVLMAVVGLRRERLWHGPAPLAWAALAGVFFALDLTFWHRSVHLVGPGLSTILANFQVFCLAGVGAWFLGETVGPRLLAAIILAMAGLFLLVGLHHGWPGHDQAWGVAHGLLTALCYSAYILTLRKLQSLDRRPSALASLAVVSLVTAAIMVVEAPLQGESLIIPDAGSWLVLAAYGICGQVLGWVLITSGLTGVAASRAGLILLLQPTLSFIWDIIIFHRPTDALAWLGAGMTLVAIYLGSLRR